MVVREPQPWILAPTAWMGSLGMQRLLHVLFGIGPIVWVLFWIVLGLEIDAVVLRRVRKEGFGLDRVAFVAMWLLAYSGVPVVLSRLLPGFGLSAFLATISA